MRTLHGQGLTVVLRDRVVRTREGERTLGERSLDDGETLDEAKRRVERNPTDLVLRYELGEKLMQAGQFTEAIPELQR